MSRSPTRNSEESQATGRCPGEQETPAERRWERVALCGLILGALVPSLLCGCGRHVPLGQVEGSVRIDGQPAGQVMVVFIPEDPRMPQSFGVTDELGKFELRCNNKSPGAAVGKHRVMVVDAAAGPAVKSRHDDEMASGPPSRIPSIYNRADRTPLRITVSAGSQTMPPIEIASEKKPEGESATRP
jgi:hypothetical protein